MTPLERAARALCELAGEAPDAPAMAGGFQRSVSSGVRLPNEGPFRWQAYTGQARAVLAAIREPSEGMTEIGSAKFRGVGIQTRQAVGDAWEVMIDAALEEGA